MQQAFLFVNKNTSSQSFSNNNADKLSYSQINRYVQRSTAAAKKRRKKCQTSGTVNYYAQESQLQLAKTCNDDLHVPALEPQGTLHFQATSSIANVQKGDGRFNQLRAFAYTPQLSINSSGGHVVKINIQEHRVLCYFLELFESSKPQPTQNASSQRSTP